MNSRIKGQRQLSPIKYCINTATLYVANQHYSPNRNRLPSRSNLIINTPVPNFAQIQISARYLSRRLLVFRQCEIRERLMNNYFITLTLDWTSWPFSHQHFVYQSRRPDVLNIAVIQLNNETALISFVRQIVWSMLNYLMCLMYLEVLQTNGFHFTLHWRLEGSESLGTYYGCLT